LEPEPRTLPGKSQAKAHANCKRHFQRAAPRVFLSQAGPRFELNWFQAEHHLWVPLLTDWFPKRRRATRLGRPRLARYAARKLARTPPSEGSAVAGPAPLVEAMPARQDCRGGRRFDEERLWFECDQHGFVFVPSRRVDETSDDCKRSAKNLTEHSNPCRENRRRITVGH
jgi:hypothetical protein